LIFIDISYFAAAALRILLSFAYFYAIFAAIAAAALLRFSPYAAAPCFSLCFAAFAITIYYYAIACRRCRHADAGCRFRHAAFIFFAMPL